MLVVTFECYTHNVLQAIYTHNHFTALLDFVRDYLGDLTPERYHQEGETNMDLLEQEIVSGNGIGWTICKARC